MIRILQTSFTFTATICLVGSLILFFHSEGQKARKLLSVIMLAWGLAFMLRVALIIVHGYVSEEIFSPALISGGIFYTIVLMIWPFEIVKPGWLNLKELFKICIPFIVVVSIYYLIIWIFDLPTFVIETLDEFFAHMSFFSVWYRIVMLFCILPYVSYLVAMVVKFNRSYKTWCENNFSSIQTFDIKWLVTYSIGVTIVSLAFFINVFFSELGTLLLHNLTTGLFFLWLLIQSLSHYNPYPEGYFFEQNILGTDKDADLLRLSIESDENVSFEKKKSAYKAKIIKWFEKDKPYLQPNFKLSDVGEIIPLNRTYLSRIFNEEFGMSFNALVRDYRMEEAKRILLANPDLPVSEVSELCGYSTPQSFHKAFVYTHDGMTPKQYIADLLTVQGA